MERKKTAQPEPISSKYHPQFSLAPCGFNFMKQVKVHDQKLDPCGFNLMKQVKVHDQKLAPCGFNFMKQVKVHDQTILSLSSTRDPTMIAQVAMTIMVSS